MATDFRRKAELSDITDRIVDTYCNVADINHLGHCPLPSPKVVVSLVDDLFEVLYPGYRRRQSLHLGNVTYYVGDLIDTLHDVLTEQIARALRHEAMRQSRVVGSDPADETAGVADETDESDESDIPCRDRDFEAEAQTITLAFLSSLPDLRAILATDVHAAFDGDPAAMSLDEIIFCYPGLEAITVYRIANRLHSLGVPLIPRIMSEWVHNRTGIDLHPAATIGPSFFIDHGTGVVIGGTCEIAENVKLYQGVTLGALSFPKDAEGKLVRGQKRHPTIERGVVVYANATVLGGETIVGANSVIGASVSLMKSVPPNTLVTIEKPQLRFREVA